MLQYDSLLSRDATYPWLDGFTVSLSAPSATPSSFPHACQSSTLSFSEHRPEALFHRIAATIETIGVLGIAKFVRGVVDTQAEAMYVPARSDQGFSIRRVSDLLVCLCWESDSSSSCDHNESCIAPDVVIMVFSIVVVIILGRNRQRTPGSGAVVGGVRLVPPLPLFHVCLVQASSAGMGLLLTAG